MQMEDKRDIDYVIFVIFGTGAYGIVSAINVHQMNFILAHSIVK